MIVEFALVAVVIVLIVTWVAWELFGDRLYTLERKLSPPCVRPNEPSIRHVHAVDDDLIRSDEHSTTAGDVVLCHVNTNTSEIDCVVKSMGPIRNNPRRIHTMLDGRVPS